MDLTLQAVRMDVGEDNGTLVFADGDLLTAVLVRLGPAQGEQEGWWFLEVGFGALDGVVQPSWATMPEALAWIAQRVDASPGTLVR